MKVCDINPHLRFASAMRYAQGYNGRHVRVRDCRIFFVTEGTAQLYIGEESYALVPHSLFFCCAGSDYTIETQGEFSLISLNFDLTQDHRDRVIPFSPWLADEEGGPAAYFDKVSDSPFLNKWLYLSGASGLQHPLERIVQEFSSNAPYHRELCGTLLKALLLELHRLNTTDIPPKVTYVKEYIEQHYAENITNKELADLVGYHEYYLNRIFSAYTGTNLHAFLVKVRLQRASFLILNSDLELKAIPEQTGFRNYPHFSSYFKKAYGYSPAEYRKRLKENI